MGLQLNKARRAKAYLKLGLAAPSGGGKTLGALIIAYGMMKEKYPNEPEASIWDKIAIIDTENGSGELYVGKDMGKYVIGEYGAVTLTAPFKAEKYIDAIELCHNSGIEVVIIDSTSHLWSGQGGLLEQHGNAAERTKNSYTAWRDITPMHNQFVDTLLQTPVHIIATMRSKQEYVQEKDEKGKSVVRKLGMEPEQRKGMEYEFTAFYDINEKHHAFGSKDRTSLYDQETFVITPEVGHNLMSWLNEGVDTSETREVLAKYVPEAEQIKEEQKAILALCKELGGQQNENLMTLLKTEYDTNPNNIKDLAKLNMLHNALLEMKN